MVAARGPDKRAADSPVLPDDAGRSADVRVGDDLSLPGVCRGDRLFAFRETGAAGNVAAGGPPPHGTGRLYRHLFLLDLPLAPDDRFLGHGEVPHVYRTTPEPRARVLGVPGVEHRARDRDGEAGRGADPAAPGSVVPQPKLDGRRST